MTGSLSPRVDPAAAVDLVGLIQEQMARLIQEHERGATTQPNLAYQLAGALESLLQDLHRDRPFPDHRALDAEAVAYVRRSVQVGRRLDMTRAFDRLNPTFGVAAEHGCWDAVPEQRARRVAVRRRELGLSLGDRVADVLDPPAEPVGGGGLMATTADYAKLGQTTYQAEVRYSDGHDPSMHHPALPQPHEFPDKDPAKAWVARQLRQLGTPGRGCFYAEVQRGTYQDASYDDRGRFSGLHHATWERQERHPYQALAYLADDGDQVAWAEDDGGEVA